MTSLRQGSRAFSLSLSLSLFQYFVYSYCLSVWYLSSRTKFIRIMDHILLAVVVRKPLSFFHYQSLQQVPSHAVYRSRKVYGLKKTKKNRSSFSNSSTATVRKRSPFASLHVILSLTERVLRWNKNSSFSFREWEFFHPLAHSNEHLFVTFPKN